MKKFVIFIFVIAQVFGDNSSAFEECDGGGKCVPYHMCDASENFQILEAEVRIMTEPNCGPLKKCCPNESVNKTARTLVTSQFCGISNSNGLGGAVTTKNDEAQFAEFPWILAVLKVGNGMKIFTGGGSLIHPSIALTAAHIIADLNAEELKVRGGEWDTQSVDEMLPFEEREVTRFVTHENFARKNLQNDLSLLFLKTSFDARPHINTICLPPPLEILTPTKCFVTGWGKDKFGKQGVYQSFLKKIELPAVPSDECQTMLRKTRFGADFNLDKSFMCAGGKKDKDACTGDGGSPLVCLLPGSRSTYYQAGIVAGSIGCGNPGIPGLYVDVSKYILWIQIQALDKGFFL